MTYTPPVAQTWALFLAIILTIIGIAALIWLIFFVVYGKELSQRDKVLGSVIRLLVMSVFMGFGVHFWLLVDLF